MLRHILPLLLLPAYGCGPTSASLSTTTDTAASSTDTSTTASTEESGEEEQDECDWDALDLCQIAAHDAQGQCLADCGEVLLECADEACHWACRNDFRNDFQACQDNLCPRPLSDSAICHDECSATAELCTNADNCEAQHCTYNHLLCVSEICHNSCYAADLFLPWSGSCELQLPGPTPYSNRDFVSLEVGDDRYDINPAGECMGQSGLVWADENYDRLILCGATCEAAELAGVIKVHYGIPPCE